MEFDGGDLLVLGILGILFFLFRHFDKNNRSLEKVRNYANKVRAQLDEIVEQKKDAIKDLSIDIDIQEKTDKEILKRVQAARDEMDKHAEQIESYNIKVLSYNERVDELVRMTAVIDENLLRIKDESGYVDTVGKRISDSLRKIQLLEKAMEALQDQFIRQNKENLENFQDRIFSSCENRLLAVDEKVALSDSKVSSFMQSVDQLEAKHQSVSEEKLALFTNELESVKDRYNGYLEEIAEKGVKLEADVFTELNDSINDTADKIEDNWKNGLHELKESVSFSVEDMKVNLSSIKEKIDLVEKDSDLKAEDIRSRIDQVDREIAAVSSTALDKTNELINNNEREVVERFSTISDKIEIFENGNDQKVEKLKQKIDNIGEETRILTEGVLEKTNSLIDSHEREASERLEVISNRFNDHETLMEKHASDILDHCKLLISEHDQDSRTLLEKIRKNMSDVTGFSHDIEVQMTQFKGDIDSETIALAEKLNKISEDLSRSIDVKADELESGLIKSVEDKVVEYEKSVSRRFDKLDGFMEDLDNLEDNLKMSLKDAISSVEKDFELFNESLMEERTIFKNSLNDDTGELRFQMSELEKGLDILKGQAYDNVSEKLKVFEDEFFSDLKKRSNSMQNNMEEWQKSVDFRMDEIDLKGSRERDELQRSSSADMKVKLTELQSSIYQQFEQFKGQILEFKENMDSSIRSTEDEIKQFNSGIREEIVEVKDTSSLYFEQQFTDYKSTITERFEKTDKVLDIKFDEVVSDFEISKKEMNSSLDQSRSDLENWQIRMSKQIKDHESSFVDQIQAFKTDVTENISIIRDDFKNQREDLIVSTNEERVNFKREITETANRIDGLNNNLEKQSVQAIDRFKSDYDDFILDFQRKTYEFQNESEIRSKEIRQGLVDTREKVEVQQKKMYDRIEDDYNLISSNLKNIEIKQQDFISQTKIFERADSLKETLDSDIAFLKEQISQIGRNRKEAFEIREEFNNMHRLNDELQSRFAKVMSEKQKIDTMDERISRIITLSESVNLKLDEISTTHDTLQDYQVRLRQIEDLQGSIDKRFVRLEKKSSLIDTTTEGVDKNFQILGTIEKAINNLKSEINPLYANMADVKDQNTAFQDEYDKVKEVVEKLSVIDATLLELDNRIDSMNKAREWVATTESRIESIGKNAREQVQLFGKLMEKDNRPGERVRKQVIGTPDMEIREMVIRLAHEGWKSEEIARTTKLSQGEVELILELSPKFSRK